MDHPATPAAPAQVFAQVTLGELLIGIDSRYVVFALPRPASLTRLPRSAGALEGVFNMDGQVVPLVDLRRWMDSAGTPLSEAAQVMVLRADGVTVGLAIDAVRGLVRLPQESIRQVHHDDTEGEFFHSVGVLDDGSLISLLDPARLMRQTRAWASNAGAAADAAGEAKPAASAPAATASTPPQVLVRVGQATLAVDAGLVAEVRKPGALQPLDLGESALAGMMQLHAHHVPVLDPGKALGIARPGAGPAALVMVLAHQGRYAALPVDSVLSVRPFAEAEVQDSDEAGLAPGGCFTGVARLEDESPVLLVDGRALIGQHGMASLTDPSASAAAGAGTADKLDPQAYVVVDAGATLALPMSCLEEITVFPADFDALPGTSRDAAGSCSWRGRSLPVLDVRDSRASSRPPEGQRLVVVRHGGRLAGLWVNDVIALLPANSVQQSHFSLAGSAPMKMLTTSQAQGRQSYRVLDPASLPFFSEAACPGQDSGPGQLASAGELARCAA